MNKKIFVACLIASSTTLAADANNPHWEVDIAPYLWAINMNGRVVNGPLTTHVAESFGKILSEFDGGAMVFMDVHKGPVGIFFNGLYTVLSDHGNIGPLDANLKTKFGLFAAGFSYILLQKNFANASQIQIEPYLGARYTLNNVRLKLDSFVVNNNKYWTDPLIGMRLRYDMNARWVMILAGDIGGTNAHTNKSYNLIGLAGYKPEKYKHTTFYLGYRNMYQNYQTGSGLKLFKWNMRLFGPMLGVNFAVI